MKTKTFNFLVCLVLFMFSFVAYGEDGLGNDGGATVSDPVIIFNNGSAGDDSRALIFCPFHIGYNPKQNQIVAELYDNETTTFILTDSLGEILSQRTVSGYGTYCITLPEYSGLFLLNIVMPELQAYVTIRLG